MPQPFADQFKSIPMSSNLGESLERAHGFAREQAHRAVTLEHLLLAFTEDTDASAVLQASNVDLVRLGTDVSGYLGRLLEDMRAENGAEPRPTPNCCASCTRRCRPPSSRAAARSMARSCWRPSWGTARAPRRAC